MRDSMDKKPNRALWGQQICNGKQQALPDWQHGVHCFFPSPSYRSLWLSSLPPTSFQLTRHGMAEACPPQRGGEAGLLSARQRFCPLLEALDTWGGEPNDARN